MKLLIPRNEVKEAVTGLAKIVSTKASLPILSHIRLDADRTVRLTGTNLDATASYTIEGHTPLPTPMSTIIPLEALQSLLKTTQGSTIEIEKTDDHSVTIGCSVGGQVISRRVSTPDLDDWPNLPEPAKTKPVAPKLLEHIRQAIPFASTEDSRYVLKTVFLDVADKDCHKVVATDGRRLNAFNSVRLPLAESVILSTSKFLAWNKLSGEPSIGADKTNEVLTLNVGPWTYVTKLVSGTFPNYKQVIPGGEGLCLLELSKEDTELLIKALPSLPNHGNSDDTVILRVEENAIRVYTREQATSGESAIKLESSVFTGKPMSIGLNRRFLQDALRAGFCRFDLVDSISPIVGRLSKEDKHSVHVLMPMRTCDTETQTPETEQTETPAQEAPVASTTVQTQQTPKKEKPMPKKEDNPATTEVSSFDKILAAYEVARSAVRDANAALSTVADAIKEAVKEDKARRSEIAHVRSGLAKLQSIKV